MSMLGQTGKVNRLPAIEGESSGVWLRGRQSVHVYANPVAEDAARTGRALPDAATATRACSAIHQIRVSRVGPSDPGGSERSPLPKTDCGRRMRRRNS
jgi:hypothetical protein